MPEYYQEGGEVGALESLSDLLSSSQQTTPEARQAATRILARYMSDETPSDDLYGEQRQVLSRMQSQAEEVRAALKQARARLLAQDPTRGQALLAASAALGRPTRTGALGETISNVFDAIRDPLAAREAFKQDRSNQLLDIDTSLAGVDSNVNQAELDLANLQSKLRSSMEEEALKVLGKPLRSGTGSATREAKIRDLVNMGLDYDTAVKVADGYLEMEVSPETSRVRLTDKVSRRAWEIPVEPNPNAPNAGANVPGAPGPQFDPRDELIPGDLSLWDLADISTGLMAGARTLASVPAAWVPFFQLPVAERTIRGRQTFDTEIQNLIRGLAVNQKFPVGEQERLLEEIHIKPDVFTDVQALHAKMESIDESLRRRMYQALADANDVNLPEDDRQAQASNAAAIRRFLPILGVPQPDEMPENLPPELRSAWPHLNDAERKELMDAYGQLQGAQQ